MRTVTFYSYKGGVGRTLTLANVAANLRLQGANVVALDFDLEAPGLYYKLARDPQRRLPRVKQGLVDILFDFIEGRPLPDRLDEHILEVRAAEGSQGWIKLLPAGTAPLSDYWRKLARIDWHHLFYSSADPPGVPLFLELKERIAAEYAPDYLLIDSRTGITEMGGICTAVLPDQVVCLLLRNQEHLDGSRAVLRGILGAPRNEYQEPIEITPVLARFPPDLGATAREQEASRIKDFLNEPGGDAAPTLKVKDVLVLQSDSLLEQYEHILLDDQRFADRPLSLDYLALYWRILPPERRPLRGVDEAPRPSLAPIIDLGDQFESFKFHASESTRSHSTQGGRSDRKVLRLVQHADATPGHYVIEVALEGAGPRLTATVPLAFALTAQDRERIRWYLEDYLLFPLDPAPKIAADIEERMAEIGDALCRAVFFADRDATRLWDRAREELADTRVEIITDVRHAASVPWELIRDPDSKTPLALEAESFVRAHRMPTKLARGAPDTSGGPIRILLVICRPRAGEDVPFRSVAAHLLQGLDHASRAIVQLDVLRPPTFADLSRMLRAAKERGKPYHVVHFDGHGAYLDAVEQKFDDVVAELNVHVLGGRHAGTHGYLVFESADEAFSERGEFVDGSMLGKLLVETGVPVLVLNACRSAHADPPTQPEIADGAAVDTHSDVQSFGSLALEVMDTGVSGVVAMRYNVYVVTAAQFVAELYGALADGLTLGAAVSRGRKQLADKPGRAIAYEPVALQDWSVPVVYEAERLPLFPAPAASRAVKLTLRGGGPRVERNALVGVPDAPDVGFFGRDETLLALDRAFDKHRVVLLHAYAGSGKTTVAAEFGRWYARTGGVEGPVLWTNFERRMPLSVVLEVLARVFAPFLEQSKIQWAALQLEDRRQVALQILKQVPVLWIWDNVEPVAGFPEGTASVWTIDEQTALVDFLRAARATKAKFLLTSRRDEQRWLGELPARITVPAMPMQERVQLARALASKWGVRLATVADWKPLLAFTQGNPLAIMVLTGQVLRDGLTSKEQVEAFVARLRAGEIEIEEDGKAGRSRSLGASLSYGFGETFGEEDRKRLALLHLFQGFVDVEVLTVMGNPEADWCLAEVRGLTRGAGTALLDRAAEIGLLTAHGEGYYSIHPAVPWYFRGVFEEHYPEERRDAEGSDARSAKRAFVEAMGYLGNYYQKRYTEGHRDMLDALEAEEPNLLHARDLARRHGWWGGVIRAMQGLAQLYAHSGRRSEWVRLVDEARVDFVDPENDGPLQGRDAEWETVNQYRSLLARETRQWAQAERLQQAGVNWARARAAAALALPDDVLNVEQRNRIRSLAAELHDLGELQCQREQRECIDSYDEAVEMARRAADPVGEATIAFSRGHAYVVVPVIRDLAEAERSYMRSLEMYDEVQRHSRARCWSQLGLVALERFQEVRASGGPKKELVEHLKSALHSYESALELLPHDAVDDLAVAHSQLGKTYGAAGILDRALPHYQDAIRYLERAGNLYVAAQARFNVAYDLASAGHFFDARAYAVAALRNFETYGDRAGDAIQKTHDLLANLDRDLNATQPA